MKAAVQSAGKRTPISNQLMTLLLSAGLDSCLSNASKTGVTGTEKLQQFEPHSSERGLSFL